MTDGYNYVQNVPLDQNMHQWLSRVDVNISNNTRLFARYNLQAEEQNFPVGLWWRNRPPGSVSDARSPRPNRSHSATVSLTKVFGTTLTTESTFGITYIDFPNQFRDPSKVSRSALGYTNPGIYHSGLDQIPSMTGWGNGPTLYNPGGFDPVLFATKWLISGAQNVTKVAGAHTMKAGAYYEWVNNSQPGNGDSNGRLILGSAAVGSSGNYFSDLLTGTLAEYGEQSPNIVRDMAYNIFEVYAQDSWKAKDRLTLEYGLRVSHLGGWTERDGEGMAVFDPSLYSASAPASQFPGRDVDGARQRRSALGRQGAVGVLGRLGSGPHTTCSARARRCCAAASASSTSTTRRALLGLHRPPVRRDVHQRDERAALAGANRQPQRAARTERRHLRGRRQAAANAELELYRSAAHPVPDDGRSRLRRQQERSPAERRPQQHQQRSVRGDDERSQRRSRTGIAR